MKRLYLIFLFLIIPFLATSQTLPDFSHPEDLHVMSKNPFALPSQLDQYDYLKHKIGSQPLMIILLEFPDSEHNPDYPPSYFTDLIFGDDPSVNGYFKEVSYNSYSFTNAGVFGWFMDSQTTEHYFVDNNYTMLAAAVEAAINAGVQFENYDTNSDNEITREELIIQMVFAAHPPRNLPWVWSTRPDQYSSEGVFTPGGLEIDTWAVRGEEYGSISLFAHELCHAALALPDLYNDDFGGDPSEVFTLMAFIPNNYTPHLSPWAKIHLGWIDPIIVAENGLYPIPSVETNPIAYVLFDPTHGVDEYFIVENRWPITSIYENGLRDQGLAIWHITEFYDDEQFNFLKGRKMVGMKWAGGDNSLISNPISAFWDCSDSMSCYDFTDNSIPRNSKWEDGTSSGIEISNISEAMETMQVFFSVNSPVSVELASFIATVEKNDVFLDWITITESNNFGFDIERSKYPYKKWDTITFLQGNGTTTNPVHYEYIDRNLQSGIYKYLLKQIDLDGSFNYSTTITTEIGIPKTFFLHQNFPNPFNSSTTINYELLKNTKVILIIYNLVGHEIRSLLIEQQSAGFKTVVWDGRDNIGQIVATGIYIYQLQAGERMDRKKMLFLK